MQLLKYIFSEDCNANSDSLGKYELIFKHSDIYDNDYIQRYDIEIDYNEQYKAMLAVDLGTGKQFSLNN